VSIIFRNMDIPSHHGLNAARNNDLKGLLI
jgi:hypothetical protein